MFKNFNAVAATEARSSALKILEAGLSSVLTVRAMEKLITVSDSTLNVGEHKFANLPALQSNHDGGVGGRLFVVGGGKASLDMSTTFERILGSNRIHRGLVVGVDAPPSAATLAARKIEYVQGTHPNQSATNVEATSKIVSMLQTAKLTENDCVVVLLSGGGSALLPLPTCSLDQLVKLNRHLLRCGIDIQQLNSIRKHLSGFSGGHLAKLASPARVISIIVSDVIGNDVSVIASGPTALDPTSLDDCRQLIQRYNVHGALGYSTIDSFMQDYRFQETPKDSTIFERVSNIVLIDSSVALNAMTECATAMGYRVRNIGTQIGGEARHVGARLVAMAERGVVVLGAGETIVNVAPNSTGRGGRNQELALSASLVENWPCDAVVASLGTDGADNGEYAGAIVEKAPTHAIAIAQEYLLRNDSTTFFEKHAPSSLLKTGLTGTNVADLFIVLAKS